MKTDSQDDKVTPMIDLYVVLLLIFIIMAVAGFQGLKVNQSTENSGASKVEKKTQADVFAKEGLMQMALFAGPFELQ